MGIAVNKDNSLLETDNRGSRYTIKFPIGFTIDKAPAVVVSSKDAISIELWNIWWNSFIFKPNSSIYFVTWVAVGYKT